jgi:Membrane bound O-acyl transferase family
MMDSSSLNVLLWVALVSALGGLVFRAVARPTTRRERWLLFALAATLPCLCPTRGILSTIFTGFCVVFSARLPDLEAVRKKLPEGRLALWLVIPMMKERPSADADRNRKAKTHIRHAALDLAAAAVLIVLLHRLDASPWPSPVRSSALILFFVWSLTGLAHGISGTLEWLGVPTEPVFDQPLRSRSIREFWSRRWNRFISRFALRHIALGARSRGATPIGQTFRVFLWSALFHEYFAFGVAGMGSVPGTMTAFFLLQAAILELIERLPFRQRLPNIVGQALTFLWMALTSPLFFRSIGGTLLELGYPEPWLPSWLVPNVHLSSLF